MWSRVVEVMLGCWLLMSPFIFSHSASRPMLWATDFGAGTAVIVCALLSFWRPTRYAHLLTLLTASGLVAAAYLSGFGTAPPAAQNQAVLGWLLLMFAVIPNEATQPPPCHRSASQPTVS